MNKQTKPPTNKMWVLLYKVGIGMIIVSLVFWIFPIIIPFISFSIGMKTTIITSAIIIAEILFWTGAVLAGKEAAVKIRGYFNPKNWRKKPNKQQEKDAEDGLDG